MNLCMLKRESVYQEMFKGVYSSIYLGNIYPVLTTYWTLLRTQQ